MEIEPKEDCCSQPRISKIRINLTFSENLKTLSPAVEQLTSKLKEFCAKPSIDQLEPLEAALPKTSPAQVAHDQGLAYLHSNRYNEAMVEFEKAIGLDPNNKEAYYGLGRAHFQMNNFGEAERAAEAALRVDPYYQPAIQLLADIKLSITPSVSSTPSPAGALGQTSTSPTSQLSPPTGAPGPAPTNVASQGSASTGQSESTGTKTTAQVLKSQRASLNRWRFITGILACVLGVWIVVLRPQMGEENGMSLENQGLRNQLSKLQMEVISLTREKQKLGSGNSDVDAREPKIARR